MNDLQIGGADCNRIDPDQYFGTRGLVKVAGTGDHRIEALRLADVYRARVVDATTASFVFEVTGSTPPS